MNKNVTSVNIPEILLSGAGRTTAGKNICNRIGLAVVLLVLVSAYIPNEVTAQTGTVTGSVTDAETGEALSGARVAIEASNYRATTDAEGRFLLRRVPGGSYRLVISHPGYVVQEISITMSAGEQLEQHAELAAELPDARHRGQARAVNRQWESSKIKSVVSSEQMDHFADYTVEDALARIAGVQVDRRGEVNLRGAGPNRYNVTIDGQRLGTTGMGDRSFDLASISTDVVRDLEVIKVITPDMDADALAGSINIITRQPVGRERIVGARLGGSANTGYFNHMGPGSRASFNYSGSPRDDFSIAVNVNHQLDNRAWESLGIVYDVFDFGNGPDDVIEQVSPGLQINTQNRLGGSIRLTYQPSNRTTYHIQSVLNNNNGQLVRHESRWAAGGDWIDPFTTGAQGGRGSYGYDAQLRDYQVHLNTVQAGARHLFDHFDLEYNAGWSQSRYNQQQFSFPFLIAGRDMSIDMEDRTRPAMQVTNLVLMQDGTIDRRQIILQPMNRIIDDHVDNTYSGRVDITVPFSLGSFKFGSNAYFTSKDGNNAYGNYRILGNVEMARFDLTKPDDIEVFDQYHIPYLIDLEAARNYFESNFPVLRRNPTEEHERSDIWNYNSTERIYAGYGMTSLEFGPLTIAGGVRMEYTDAQYDGRQVTINFLNQHASTIDTSRGKDYLHLFPSAQFSFAPGVRSIFRLAYSRSIARPDFNQLAPFELIHVRNLTLYRGNPDLEPMISDNLDLIFEHYPGNAGSISVGLFYKELSNFIFQSQREVADGEFAGYQERTFRNGDETAAIYGIETSWQQRLSFLPGFLGNLGAYANYTWSHSVFDTDIRDDEVALPYHSPHVVNAALDYSQGRFFTRLSYHWTAAALNGLQETTSVAPAIHQSQEVYMDVYQDGWTNMSVSMEYRITDNFRFWADATNLLGSERVRYAHSRDLYPVATDFNGGRGIRFGIRFSL